ncbi:NRDE family protein [Sphingobium yanoikuyae]|uniref:NRDE family protein n=1 Tax=Sphingobium yanoikuyae TaxID=13690 RepID=UPI0026E967C1|nr:NRDE family protein [Sphingobium yanoikuyae]
MCIVALAWRAHPRWQLVLIGNRDEYHAPPAAAMARWDDRPGLIAGRDLQSGGTWLGADEDGRAAVITNLRGFGDPLPDRASRGALVTDLLTGAGIYADPHAAALDDFNPFNLLLADRDRLVFLTNRPEPQRSLLAPGLYGLSNGPLDQPWPKTLALKEAMLQWLVAGATDPENLFDALRRETLPATGIAPATPSDAPLEPPLSPIFIRNPVYGTRCSSILAIAPDGTGLALERRFNAQGEVTGDSRIRFDWPAA